MSDIDISRYGSAVAALQQELAGRPAKLVAIDGRSGAGKSTLGRFLAHHLNVTLVETDCFLLGNKGVAYHEDQLHRVITSRTNKGRPVLVEGICLLQLLRKLDLNHDYLIYVDDDEFDPPYQFVFSPDDKTYRAKRLNAVVAAYEAEFDPKAVANIVV